MTPWKKGDIPEGQLPNPSDLLGVTLWVNCYRCGEGTATLIFQRKQSNIAPLMESNDWSFALALAPIPTTGIATLG